MSGTVSEPALTSSKLRTNNNRKCYFLTESKPDYYSVFLFYSSEAHLNVVHGFRLRPKLSRPATDPENLLGVRDNEKASDVKRECPHRSRSESRVVQSGRKSFHLRINKKTKVTKRN